MPRKITNTLPAVDSSTLNKPHILSQIRDEIIGKHSLTQAEQEQILDHLTTCTYCQIAIEMVITAMLDETVDSSSKDTSHELLLQLKETNHKIQEREEHIAAYTETLEVSGVEEADKRFPELAEHLRHCNICKAEVEDMRVALKQAEQGGLIEPLKRSAKTRA